MAIPAVETRIDTGINPQPTEITNIHTEIQPRIIIQEYDPKEKSNWFTHQVVKAFHEDSSYSVWPQSGQEGQIIVTANDKASLAFIDFHNRPLIQALSLSFDDKNITYIDGSSEEQCHAIQMDIDQITEKTKNRSTHLRGRIQSTYAQSAIKRYVREKTTRVPSNDFSLREHTATVTKLERFLGEQNMNGYTPFGVGSVDIEDIEGLLREEIELMKKIRNDHLTPSSGEVTIYTAD